MYELKEDWAGAVKPSTGGGQPSDRHFGKDMIFQISTKTATVLPTATLLFKAYRAEHFGELVIAVIGTIGIIPTW